MTLPVRKCDALRKEKANGEKRYEGPLCAKHNSRIRYSANGRCVDCAREKYDEYMQRKVLKNEADRIARNDRIKRLHPEKLLVACPIKFSQINPKARLILGKSDSGSE